MSELYFDNNKIEEIPPEIGLLNKLQFLFLNQNKIKTIPSEINKLTNLVDLGFSQNKIEIVPSLEIKCEVDLRDNPVREVHPSSCKILLGPKANYRA